MKYLATIAAALLAAAPAFAGFECLSPPGSASGTAKWASKGKKVRTYLSTNASTIYECGPNIKQNDAPKQVGRKVYFKQTCGPLAIVQEVKYRPCTFEERAGIGRGYGLSSELTGALSKYLCATSGDVTSDTRYELRDKEGGVFKLGTEYGLDTGNSRIRNSCTASVKTKLSTKTWRVGLTSKKVSLTTVTEYQAERIRQPSL